MQDAEKGRKAPENPLASHLSSLPKKEMREAYYAPLTLQSLML